MRTLLLFCFAASSLAQLPSPPRNRPGQQAAPKEDQKGANAQGNPVIPSAVAGKKNQPTSPTKTGQADEQALNVLREAFAPETWSNWVYVCVTLGAVIVAFRTLGVISTQTEAASRAAGIAEQTLLLTERADVLVAGTKISTYPQFTPDTVMGIMFKNFGRTRANRAEVKASLFIPGIEMRNGPLPPIVPAVVGAGDTLTAKFHPMVACLTQDTFAKVVNGDLALRFEAEVLYFDVFDKRHRTKSSGAFDPESCSFHLDENQEAD